MEGATHVGVGPLAAAAKPKPAANATAATAAAAGYWRGSVGELAHQLSELVQGEQPVAAAVELLQHTHRLVSVVPQAQVLQRRAQLLVVELARAVAVVLVEGATHVGVGPLAAAAAAPAYMNLSHEAGKLV